MLAATAAAVAHETLGHGLGCLAVGGRVTLLTSIYFKCAGSTWLTDAGGPLGGLALGAASLAALKLARPMGRIRLLLILCTAIDLGWVAGQLLYCAALNVDDWSFVAKALRWPPLWRGAAGVAGITLYVATIRLLAAEARQVGGVKIAAIAAAGSAALAGLLWSAMPLRGALEGAAAVGLAPAVILAGVIRRQGAAVPSSAGGRPWAWVAAATVVYGLFLVGQARGLGPLA